MKNIKSMKKMNVICMGIKTYRNTENLWKMYILAPAVLEKIHKNIPWMNDLYDKHEFYTLYFELYNKDKDI